MSALMETTSTYSDGSELNATKHKAGLSFNDSRMSQAPHSDQADSNPSTSGLKLTYQNYLSLQKLTFKSVEMRSRVEMFNFVATQKEF